MVEHAQAVIIGGGVGGTSIAYHLTELGWRDVILRRPGGPYERLDVPFGRPGRPAPQHHDPDPHDDVRGGAVPPPERRDGGRRLVARGGLAAPGQHAGAVRGAAAPGGLGPHLRPAPRAADDGRDADALPADGSDRRARRGVPADRRLARPLQPRPRAGRRGPGSRGAHPDRAPRHGHPGRAGARPRRDHRPRRDRGRRGRGRGRHVRPGDRPPGRGGRADHPHGPPVPAHEAPRRGHAGHAHHARPRQPRLLPRGGGRPVHGRLRAGPGPVGPGRGAGRLQRPAAAARLAPLRGDHAGRRAPRPGHGRRRR